MTRKQMIDKIMETNLEYWLDANTDWIEIIILEGFPGLENLSNKELKEFYHDACDNPPESRPHETNSKPLVSKDDRAVIEIPKDYIQDFVEANYGRRLTESELKELSWLVWDDWDSDLLNWIGAAVDQIIKPNKVNKYKL